MLVYDYDVVVLIPCYNEETSIANVIEDFQDAMPTSRIYVYNNNSTDKTAMIAEQMGVHVVKALKQGKGNVVKQMFRDVDADIYLMVDGDYTYFAKNAESLISGILDGYDMVIGDRLSSTYYTENKRPFHNVGNRTVRFLVNHFFKGDVNDIMTGYRAFSRDFVKSIDIKSEGFEIETEMTIWALKEHRKIGQVVVDYKDRVGSKSKLCTVKDGIKILKYIFREKFAK